MPSRSGFVVGLALNYPRIVCILLYMIQRKFSVLRQHPPTTGYSQGGSVVWWLGRWTCDFRVTGLSPGHNTVRLFLR